MRETFSSARRLLLLVLLSVTSCTRSDPLSGDRLDAVNLAIAHNSMGSSLNPRSLAPDMATNLARYEDVTFKSDVKGSHSQKAGRFTMTMPGGDGSKFKYEFKDPLNTSVEITQGEFGLTNDGWVYVAEDTRALLDGKPYHYTKQGWMPGDAESLMSIRSVAHWVSSLTGLGSTGPTQPKMTLDGEPVLGTKNAAVTIVEYADFQCPFCKRGYDIVESRVLKEYEGKVAFYYRHFPLAFHAWAMPGAIAAECAKIQEPKAFWKLYDGFFSHQREINPENVKEKATEYLQDTGIDLAEWSSCYDEKETLPKITAQSEEGSARGVTGTPTFFINGRMLVGAQPFEKFKEAIDGALASAK